MKVEIYGNNITKIANNQELQNEFYLKYNEFIDQFIYLNDKVYSCDKTMNRDDVRMYLRYTIYSLKKCEDLIKHIENIDDLN